MNLTHADLVKEATQWLGSSRRCRFVVKELVCTGISEIPDALGWAGEMSVMVECKVSRSDFRRDVEKHHRRGEGLGQERWFYAPEGVIPVGEVPAGWGLLERKPSLAFNGYMCRKRLLPAARAASEGMLLNERAILISAAWRACEAVTLVKPLSIHEEA